MSQRADFGHTLFIIGAWLGLLLLGAGCGSEQTDGGREQLANADSSMIDSTASESTSVDDPKQNWVMTPPPDSPEELQRKIQKIYDWYPKHEQRLDWLLEGVTKVSFFSELGLGDELEVALPGDGQAGWPVGNAIRFRLAGEKTALVLRFTADTLPGPRARGEGELGILALHCSDTLGREVALERTQTGTGRFDLQMTRQFISADLACCDIPPGFLLRGYGTMQDTLALIVVFEKPNLKYSMHFMGPLTARSFPGFGYAVFRTERGEFHKELTDFPYICRPNDPDYVGLFIGSKWRGRKSVMQPIIRVRIF